MISVDWAVIVVDVDLLLGLLVREIKSMGLRNSVYWCHYSHFGCCWMELGKEMREIGVAGAGLIRLGASGISTHITRQPLEVHGPVCLPQLK